MRACARISANELAVLLGLDRGDALGVLGDRLAPLHQQAAAARRRQRAPRALAKRRRRRRHGVIDVLGPGQRERSPTGRRSWIECGKASARPPAGTSSSVDVIQRTRARSLQHNRTQNSQNTQSKTVALANLRRVLRGNAFTNIARRPLLTQHPSRRLPRRTRDTPSRLRRPPACKACPMESSTETRRGGRPSPPTNVASIGVSARTGTHRVDADAIRGQLDGHRLRRDERRALAAVVGECRFGRGRIAATDTVFRMTPPPCRLHDRDGMTRGQEDRLGVDREQPIPLLFAGLDQRLRRLRAPALLTSTSSRPNRATAASIIACASARGRRRQIERPLRHPAPARSARRGRRGSRRPRPARLPRRTGGRSRPRIPSRRP